MRKNVVPLIGAVVLIKLKPAHHLDGLRDGAGKRPARRHRRPFTAHGPSHAPAHPPVTRPGSKVGTLNPQPCRRGGPAAGRADRHEHLHPAADRRAYRCHARHPPFRADIACGVAWHAPRGNCGAALEVGRPGCRPAGGDRERRADERHSQASNHPRTAAPAPSRSPRRSPRNYAPTAPPRPRNS